MAVLAAATGVADPVAAVAATRVVAAAYHPGTDAAGADEALAALLALLPPDEPEALAQHVALLVQACEATAGLVRGDDLPVKTTKRVTADGTIVAVDLTGRPFGEGARRCPGERHARALAEACEVTSFADLHQIGDPLVLPNAWDFASAAALVAAGFEAVGTTSLGVAAGLGKRDGVGNAWEETRALALRLVRLDAHITIDFEHGFSEDPAEVAEHAAQLEGVAGINLEDRYGDPAHHAAVIAAVKHRLPDLFVNARTDTHWLRDGELDGGALPLPASMSRRARTGCSCPACRSRTSTRSRTRSTRRSTSSTSPGRPWRTWPRAARRGSARARCCSARPCRRASPRRSRSAPATI